jgi:hypothetical protein
LTNCGSGAANDLAENRASDVRVNHSRSMTERPLSPGASFTVTDKVQIPSDAKINVPLAEHLYEPMALGLNLNLRCEYEIDQTKLGIDLPVRGDCGHHTEAHGSDYDLGCESVEEPLDAAYPTCATRSQTG